VNIKYRVDLSQEEREELEGMLKGGKVSARKLVRAQILLAADKGISDEGIAGTLHISGSTIYRTKRRFVEGNLEGALSDEPRPGAERKLSTKETALLVATACSAPPPGRARWTFELLADEMVKLTDHDDLSRETVRRRLAENQLKPWRRTMWCIPKVDGEYVARMEDVLDLYAEPPDPLRPVICFDDPRIKSGGLPNSSARSDNRSPPSPVSFNATIASTAATEPSTSSSSSTPTVPGARSRSRTAGPTRTSPSA
jgi:transposase